jgi:hypothetical protein
MRLILIVVVMLFVSTVSAAGDYQACQVTNQARQICARGQIINLNPDGGDGMELFTNSPDGTFTLIQYNIGAGNYLSAATEKGLHDLTLEEPAVFLGWSELTNSAFFYQEATNQVLHVVRTGDEFSLNIAFTLRTDDVVVGQMMSPSCGALALLVTRGQTNILVTYQEHALSGQPQEHTPSALEKYDRIVGWFETEDSCSIMLDVVEMKTIEL